MIGGESKMRTALNLLNEITGFGFDQRKALICIDKILDKKLGIGCRKPLSDEELPNVIYDGILCIFEEKAGRNKNNTENNI